MKFCSYLMLAFCAFAMTPNADAQEVTFGLFDGTAAANDLNGVGDMVTESDVTLTIESLAAMGIDTTPDPAVLSGETTDNVSIFISGGGLGLNNGTALNGDAAEATGAFPESSTINGGEEFVFSLDTDVTFSDIRFFGFDDGEFATVTVDGLGPVTFNNANPTESIVVDGDTSVVFFQTDPFGDDLIEAGTLITVAGGNLDDEFQFNSFTVTVPTSVPEPSSLAILGLGGLLMVTRRRR